MFLFVVSQKYYLWSAYIQLTCLVQIMGEVTWHGEWVLFLYGEEFYWYGPKIIFFSTYTSVHPQKHFFNIIHFVGIANHVTCTFGSELPWIFMYKCLFVSTFWNFYIMFCGGMLGRHCGWSDMAWQMNPSYLTEGYSDMFIKWTSVLWCDMVPHWHLFEMFAHFCIFESILSRWACIIWYSWYLHKFFFYKNVIYVN